MRLPKDLQSVIAKQHPVLGAHQTFVSGTGAFCSRAGVTLVELLVVSTIMVLIAAIGLPTLQLVRQREKENRLKEILTYVRSSGIGVGTPRYTIEAYSANNAEFSSDGYRNFMIRKIMGQIGISGFTYANASYAIATGTFHGTIYPASPPAVIYALGQSTSFPTAEPPAETVVTVPVTQRFIRNIPPHPFEDWYPNAHWEFKAATDTNAAGPWFDWPSTFDTPAWPADATGVIDIKSIGAGIAINGEKMDSW